MSTHGVPGDLQEMLRQADAFYGKDNLNALSAAADGGDNVDQSVAMLQQKLNSDFITGVDRCASKLGVGELNHQPPEQSPSDEAGGGTSLSAFLATADGPTETQSGFSFVHADSAPANSEAGGPEPQSTTGFDFLSQPTAPEVVPSTSAGPGPTDGSSIFDDLSALASTAAAPASAASSHPAPAPALSPSRPARARGKARPAASSPHTRQPPAGSSWGAPAAAIPIPWATPPAAPTAAPAPLSPRSSHPVDLMPASVGLGSVPPSASPPVRTHPPPRERERERDAAAAAAAAAAEHSQRLVQLQGQVDSLQAEVAQLKEQLVSRDAELTELRGRVADHQTAVADLQAELGAARAELAHEREESAAQMAALQTELENANQRGDGAELRASALAQEQVLRNKTLSADAERLSKLERSLADMRKQLAADQQAHNLALQEQARKLAKEKEAELAQQRLVLDAHKLRELDALRTELSEKYLKKQQALQAQLTAAQQGGAGLGVSGTGLEEQVRDLQRRVEEQQRRHEDEKAALRKSHMAERAADAEAGRLRDAQYRVLMAENKQLEAQLSKHRTRKQDMAQLQQQLEVLRARPAPASPASVPTEPPTQATSQPTSQASSRSTSPQHGSRAPPSPRDALQGDSRFRQELAEAHRQLAAERARIVQMEEHQRTQVATLKRELALLQQHPPAPAAATSISSVASTNSSSAIAASGSSSSNHGGPNSVAGLDAAAVARAHQNAVVVRFLMMEAREQLAHVHVLASVCGLSPEHLNALTSFLRRKV